GPAIAGIAIKVEDDSDIAQRAHEIANLSTIFGIMVVHFIASLFIPWTPKEAVRPLVPLLILYTLRSLIFSGAPIWLRLIFIALSPLIAVPGVAVAAWRTSRFRERFNIQMLKGRYGEIKQELASARQIHESLFPSPITTGPVRFEYRYEPMRQIGGDYLFVKQAEINGKAQPILHMAIVDVTGHGIGAALTVNRLYGEIARRFGENSNATPGEILTGLNDYLHHSLATHSVYATAVCLRFDPNTDALAWASAGHPPAFLRTVDGKIERLDSTTLVLGACRGDDFHHNEQATRFHKGDTLLLYTDGAIETRNAQGRMLGLRGFEGLITSVHPDEAGGYASSLLRGVDEHRFGPPQDDTLIVEVWRPLRS
ncbi:MAG: serine/threonine-protein phosphatase, partial [Phycisphaerae bacterium]|nr:serine/threonine-protein phosphatase [Phycisphaerae bacterium]